MACRTDQIEMSWISGRAERTCAHTNTLQLLFYFSGGWIIWRECCRIGTFEEEGRSQTLCIRVRVWLWMCLERVMDRVDPRFLWLSLRSTARRGAGYGGSLLISAHTGRSQRGWTPWIKGEQPSHRDWWKANAWLSLISFTSTILPEVGGAYVRMCVRKGTNNTPLGWDFIKQILVMNNGVVTLIECERGGGWSTMQKR